jgi:nicotinamidase-related amidase
MRLATLLKGIGVARGKIVGVTTDPRRAAVLARTGRSGLAGNDLPELLAARGIDTVLVTAVATNLTVEQTARHGTDLGGGG